MNIRCARGHHASLYVGDAPVRKQDNEICIVAPGKRIDRSAASIAGRRHHNGRALATLGEHMIHQPRKQVHRHVFERERRAVKQLQHETIRCDLVQRHHRRMPERGVGFIRHLAEIRFGDFSGHERTITSTATSQ